MFYGWLTSSWGLYGIAQNSPRPVGVGSASDIPSKLPSEGEFEDSSDLVPHPSCRSAVQEMLAATLKVSGLESLAESGLWLRLSQRVYMLKIC